MPNTPIQDGLYGFSTLSISDDPSRSVWAKAKFTSALNIKKGTPVIATAGNTLDRCAVTGGTNEVTTLTPTQGAANTGGTFQIVITINAVVYTTAAIAYNATVAQVQAAIDLVFQTNANPISWNPTNKPRIGTGNVLVAGAGPLFTTAGGLGTAMTLTFRYVLGSRDIAQPTITSALTGTTPVITPTTTTAGVYGYDSSAAVHLGLSNEWMTAGGLGGPAASFSREFSQAPNNLDGPFASTARQLTYHAMSPINNRFLARIEPFVAVAATLVGTTMRDFGYWADLDQFYLSTLVTTNGLVQVVGIPPDQLGVFGGQVICQYDATKVIA